MHTVDLLAEALQTVKGRGYEVRVELLDDAGGGVCEFGGKKLLFLDAAHAPLEQLHAVLEVLRQEMRRSALRVTPALAKLLEPRRAA
jgi:hypothetical protein